MLDPAFLAFAISGIMAELFPIPTAANTIANIDMKIF
jgi:hypothetical protein